MGWGIRHPGPGRVRARFDLFLFTPPLRIHDGKTIPCGRVDLHYDCSIPSSDAAFSSLDRGLQAIASFYVASRRRAIDLPCPYMAPRTTGLGPLSLAVAGTCCL